MITLSGKAQLFSFADTSTTIIKNTNQSPAHWYLEITSNCIVDTTLRWKVHFDSIPSEWNINFDCQNQNWPTVLDGDSSDFTMFYDADFPQKLIIGAELNNTPGHGFIYFDIYDPLNPSDVQTISYEYIIGIAEISQFESLGWLNVLNDKLIITDNSTSEIVVTDQLGRLLFQSQTGICALSKDQPNLVHIRRGQETYFLRIVID